MSKIFASTPSSCRYALNQRGWNIEKIMDKPNFPALTHKDLKTAYSTHFKFADKFSSYRRVYSHEALYDRIMLAFQDGVVGYTNETISNKTRFCIDVDGISSRSTEVLPRGKKIEVFVQEQLKARCPPEPPLAASPTPPSHQLCFRRAASCCLHFPWVTPWRHEGPLIEASGMFTNGCVS